MFFKPPLPPDIENNSTMIDLVKEVVIYFWYGKPGLNAFSGIWDLDRLQNKHKQKEPNFPEFPNFLSVQIRNKISKSITVNQRFYLIFKRGFQYRYCFDLLQLVLFILIQAMQKYKVKIKTFFINYCVLDLSKICINSSRPSFQLVGGYNIFSSFTTYSKYSTSPSSTLHNIRSILHKVLFPGICRIYLWITNICSLVLTFR